MSSDVAISVRNLSKTYRIFGHPGDRVRQALTLGRLRFHREFTALKDVSFDVRKGETIGIIGRNGSGKSTLLQLICGILKPTSGTVALKGHVSALLELGAGFNPEFTGRENVYFQGAVMGRTRAEMAARFDDIASFADIGAFIDQPVRTYSSGMFVRLAFATMIHADADILVVDEALAVGDEAFQRKCFGWLNQFVDRGGVLLFVSHSSSAVLELCNHALLLDQGHMVAQGQPKEMLDLYHEMVYSAPVRDSNGKKPDLSPDHVPSRREGATPIYDPDLKPLTTLVYESLGARIIDPRLTTEEGVPVNLVRRGQSVHLQYRVMFEQGARNVRFAMLLKTTTGLEISGALSSAPDSAIPQAAQGTAYQVEFVIDAQLNPGVYFVNCGVLGADGFLHRIVDALVFKVLPEVGDVHTGMTSLCRLKAAQSIFPMEASVLE